MSLQYSEAIKKQAKWLKTKGRDVKGDKCPQLYWNSIYLQCSAVQYIEKNKQTNKKKPPE